MDLWNQSSASAVFVSTMESEDHLLGGVAVKAAFRCAEGALLADARGWPAGGEPVKTEFGELDGETPFLRTGVDLIVLGKAYPKANTASSLTLSIRVGSLRHDIAVFGDRRWVRSGVELVASRPEPFDAMPLTWERAYGGKLSIETGSMPFAANPAGRGFYMEAAQAEGQLLPNLEDPARLVRSFKDQPEPRCPAPCTRDSALRIERAAEYDLSGPAPRIVKLKPAYFNNAHPRLVLEAAPAPGEEIEITHVRPRGESLRFSLPALGYHVYVQLAERPYVFPAHLESIVVLPEESRVVLGYKCTFRYRMVPLERRIAVLREGAAPAAAPSSYHVRWPDVEAHGVAVG